MTDSNPEALARRCSAIEIEAKLKFGEENWGTAMVALGKAGGIDQAEAPKLLAGQDAADKIWMRGMDALRAQADTSPEANAAFMRIRKAEREAHDRLKGRIR
jgi:hypothetical protein